MTQREPSPELFWAHLLLWYKWGLVTGEIEEDEQPRQRQQKEVSHDT